MRWLVLLIFSCRLFGGSFDDVTPSTSEEILSLTTVTLPPSPVHEDPRSQKPHGHVPGVTNPDGTPWLPIYHYRNK